jgi:cytochrome c peroxidase
MYKIFSFLIDFFQNVLEVMALASLKAGAKAPVPSFARGLILISFAFANEPILPIPKVINYNRDKALLGKKLFNDTILSKDNTISCATCHILLSGGDNNIKFSFGIGGQEGNINAPTVYNSIYNFRQTWNGRNKDLASQALGVIENPIEMGDNVDLIISKLKKNEFYSKKFNSIYSNGITTNNLINAIAEFEKALITPNAPFDKFLNGDKNAISQDAKDGYKLFKSKGCILCHHGINIGGNLYNKFGIYEDANSSRLGRYEVTKREEDKFVFKVPSLRNVDLTAPYMHDGRVKTLREAVEIMTQYQIGRYMKDGDIDKIVEFLKTLNGQIPKIAK